MPGEKLEELARVALIGVEGQRSQAPLPAEHLQPVGAGVEKVLSGAR